MGAGTGRTLRVFGGTFEGLLGPPSPTATQRGAGDAGHDSDQTKLRGRGTSAVVPPRPSREAETRGELADGPEAMAVRSSVLPQNTVPAIAPANGPDAGKPVFCQVPPAFS